MAAKQVKRSRVRFGAAAAVPAALVLALSGCSTAETSPAVPAVPPSSSPAQVPAPSASGLPARFQAAETALTDLLAANSSPSRDAVRQAYVSAGFSPDIVEVSQDGTPTGLSVDSIVSAAPDDGQCLIGEIRGGNLTVTTVPALANGQCLLGDDK